MKKHLFCTFFSISYRFTLSLHFSKQYKTSILFSLSNIQENPNFITQSATTKKAAL